MNDPGRRDVEERVLLLAPTEKDAAASRDILAGAGIASVICKDLGEVCSEMGRGAGAVLLTQEAILSDGEGLLLRVLEEQPPWSDFPLVVLTPAGAESVRAGRALEAVGHMTQMKRPVTIRALVSTIQAALRDRRRQCETRDHLAERDRLVASLREGERNFRSLAETIPQLAWMARPDGHIFWYNRRWYEYTGTSPEQMEGWGWQSVHDPDELAQVLERWMASISTGEPFDMVFPLRGADGRFRSFLTRIVPFRDAEGRILLWFGTNTDIEDQKRTEQAIRESEEHFRTLARATPGIVWTNLPDGTIDYANQRWFDLTGQSAEHVYSPEGWMDALHPDDRGRAGSIYTDSVRAGEAFEMEARFLRASDRTYRWYLIRAVPLRDAGGAVVKFFGTCTDIDEQKRSAEAIRARAAQLHKLAEISARINAAHDVDSVVGVVTEEARTLIGAHQAATSMVLDPQHPQPVNAVSTSKKYPYSELRTGPEGLALYDAVGKANQTVRLTQSAIGADPRWRGLGMGAAACPPLNGWLATPLVARNGRSMGLIQLSDKCEGEFTQEDESILIQLALIASVAIENARLYQELRENDRRKNEFLAMLAHELRNPLAAIGNAVTLTRRSGRHEHVEWSLEVIGRQIKHLSRLIDDLLDVSRISRGKIELRREHLELGPILDSAVETVRPLIEDRKHAIEVEVDRGSLWAFADPTRLEQVVVNLLGNAAKYSENGGQIRLSARREGGDLVISVRDAGVGIAPEALPQMFELFAQGDRSLARSEGGLGIGLTLVRKLVEMHGGEVTGKSEGVGRGSEFTVRLPAANRPAAPGVRAQGPAGEVARPSSRILVVDDSVDTARGMARLLKLLGHDVRTAHSGPEAIEEARAHNPEIVLLDIGLPGMDGFEVATRLRGEPCGRDAVIIAVSGYGQEEDRRRSKKAGFDHHLVKPLDHDALLTLISRA